MNNYATRKTAKTKTGSNDARRVVWALGEYFSYIFFVLLDSK
jgi:hypothetical protein